MRQEMCVAVSRAERLFFFDGCLSVLLSNRNKKIPQPAKILLGRAEKTFMAAISFVCLTAEL